MPGFRNSADQAILAGKNPGKKGLRTKHISSALSEAALFCCNYSAVRKKCYRCFSRQISWVMVPMGQKLHQVRGRYSAMTMSPIRVEVSMML